MEANGTKAAKANFEACIGNHPDREPNPGEPVGPDDPNATDEPDWPDQPGGFQR
jgi:hypothetical protein